MIPLSAKTNLEDSLTIINIALPISYFGVAESPGCEGRKDFS